MRSTGIDNGSGCWLLSQDFICSQRFWQGKYVNVIVFSEKKESRFLNIILKAMSLI